MRKLYLYYFATFLLASFSQKAHSQPVIQWSKCYGGSEEESFYSIVQTSDGGYVAVGQTNSEDGEVKGLHSQYYSDYWVVKVDSLGNLLWQKCLGGSLDDVAYSVINSSHGGFMIAGLTSSSDGDVPDGAQYDYTAWIVKLSDSGNMEWEKAISTQGDVFGQCIINTKDGGYAITGYAYDWENSNLMKDYEDFDIIKVDSLGNEQWEKLYGGTQEEFAYSLQQTPDRGYIVVGQTDSQDGDVTGYHAATPLNYEPDGWIVKLDSMGNLQWEKCIGGTDEDAILSVNTLAGNKYLVAGYTRSNDGDVSGIHSIGYDDCWVVKLDSVGNILWQKCLGGSSFDRADCIIPTKNGGFCITGYSGSSDGDVSGNFGNYDIWVAVLDSDAKILWEKNLGGEFFDQAYSVIQTKDEGIVVAGETASDDDDVSNNHGNHDCLIIKLYDFPDAIAKAELPAELNLYPDPADNMVHIELTNQMEGIDQFQISDLLGREVKSSINTDGTGTYTVITNNYSNGIYLFRCTDFKGNIYFSKFIIAHE